MGNYLLVRVSVSSLVLLKTMMELERLNLPICQVLSGSAYSSKEGRMEGRFFQIHSFYTVNMIVLLKAYNNCGCI